MDNPRDINTVIKDRAGCYFFILMILMFNEVTVHVEVGTTLSNIHLTL